MNRNYIYVGITDNIERRFLQHNNGENKSTKAYAIVGLLLGMFVGIIAVSWKIINKYLGEELNKAIEKAAKPKVQPEIVNA